MTEAFLPRGLRILVIMPDRDSRIRIPEALAAAGSHLDVAHNERAGKVLFRNAHVAGAPFHVVVSGVTLSLDWWIDINPETIFLLVVDRRNDARPMMDPVQGRCRMHEIVAPPTERIPFLVWQHTQGRREITS